MAGVLLPANWCLTKVDRYQTRVKSANHGATVDKSCLWNTWGPVWPNEGPILATVHTFLEFTGLRTLLAEQLVTGGDANTGDANTGDYLYCVL